MSTKLYLTDIASDVSGFLLAMFGTRASTATTVLDTAVTTTTAGVTTNGMTLTAGGTAAKWITRPIAAAVTVSGTIGVNFWSFESAAAALAGVDFQLFRFSATAAAQVGNAFATTSINAHAVVTTPTRTFVTIAPTSTALSVSDRVIILPNVNPSQGAEGGSQTVTMDFNGLTQGADGDTWIELNEDLSTTVAQQPMRAGGPSAGELEDLRVGILSQANFVGQYWSQDARAEDILTELAAQRDLQGA